MEDLARYMHHFQTLNPSKSFGGAPHKPVLLLTVAKLILDGVIAENRIYVATPELKTEFGRYWEALVRTPHTRNYALPFFHLKREGFWRLVPKRGCEIPVTSSKSIRSLKALEESLEYAELDEALFRLLQDPVSNELLTAVLKETYFPGSEAETARPLLFAEEPELEVSDVETVYYAPIIERLKTREAYVLRSRDAAFRTHVLRTYDYRCAISALKTRSPFSNARLVEACHIRPFAASVAETITNGIALTGTLHTAFDAGFITVDEHYRVKVSPTLREYASSYQLAQFHEQPLLLPVSRIHHPSMENLRWHWENRFIA